jgi:hypothetical protein
MHALPRGSPKSRRYALVSYRALGQEWALPEGCYALSSSGGDIRRRIWSAKPGTPALPSKVARSRG